MRANVTTAKHKSLGVKAILSTHKTAQNMAPIMYVLGWIILRGIGVLMHAPQHVRTRSVATTAAVDRAVHAPMVRTATAWAFASVRTMIRADLSQSPESVKETPSSIVQVRTFTRTIADNTAKSVVGMSPFNGTHVWNQPVAVRPTVFWAMMQRMSVVTMVVEQFVVSAHPIKPVEVTNEPQVVAG